jgi:hypothetical protein
MHIGILHDGIQSNFSNSVLLESKLFWVGFDIRMNIKRVLTFDFQVIHP